MEARDLPNAQDQVRTAIKADLPEDDRTRGDWATVFSLTSFLGIVTILAGMAFGLWIGFGAHSKPGIGMWIVLACLVWGSAAVSVSRDGREVCLGIEPEDPSGD